MSSPSLRKTRLPSDHASSDYARIERAIAFLRAQHPAQPSLQRLAEHLGLSAASINNMLKKLRADDLVELEVLVHRARRLELERRNVAERLYRVTGAGIYRDSVLTGQPVPIKEPLLNAEGRLIGINSAGGGTFNNRGYAIEVDHVRLHIAVAARVDEGQSRDAAVLGLEDELVLRALLKDDPDFDRDCMDRAAAAALLAWMGAPPEPLPGAVRERLAREARGLDRFLGDDRLR